ncbi:hypothetical protein CHUAL_003552 [Chamberlinius hualienensis]
MNRLLVVAICVLLPALTLQVDIDINDNAKENSMKTRGAGTSPVAGSTTSSCASGGLGLPGLNLENSILSPLSTVSELPTFLIDSLIQVLEPISGVPLSLLNSIIPGLTSGGSTGITGTSGQPVSVTGSVTGTQSSGGLLSGLLELVSSLLGGLLNTVLGLLGGHGSANVSVNAGGGGSVGGLIGR